MITEIKAKYIFAGFTIACMTGLQLVAWYLGHDGTVFAVTTGISGLAAGAALGFEYATIKK